MRRQNFNFFPHLPFMIPCPSRLTASVYCIPSFLPLVYLLARVFFHLLRKHSHAMQSLGVCTSKNPGPAYNNGKLTAAAAVWRIPSRTITNRAARGKIPVSPDKSETPKQINSVNKGGRNTNRNTTRKCRPSFTGVHPGGRRGARTPWNLKKTFDFQGFFR